MSLPLKDLRYAVSQQTHAVLSACAEARGVMLHELLQQITEEWAMKTMHETIVLHDTLTRKGALPDDRGQPRKNAD